MAAFNFTGYALITWREGPNTVQFIDYAADTGTLSVWPVDTNEVKQDREYLGQMRDHPAQHMHFLHGYK
jgi:hypothetical protein